MPYIDTNQLRVHIYPLILNHRPPSPPQLYPSELSQNTGFECPASCIELALVIYFTNGNIHVSVLFAHIIPPLPSPTQSKSLFFTSVSLLLPCIQDRHYHLSKSHIYALIYCIGVSLSDLLHSVNRLQFHPPVVHTHNGILLSCKKECI